MAATAFDSVTVTLGYRQPRTYATVSPSTGGGGAPPTTGQTWPRGNP